MVPMAAGGREGGEWLTPFSPLSRGGMGADGRRGSNRWGGGARYWGGGAFSSSILLSPSTLGGLRMSLDPLLGKCIVLVFERWLGDGSVGISLHAVARGVWVVRDHSHRSTSAAFDLPPKV